MLHKNEVIYNSIAIKFSDTLLAKNKCNIYVIIISFQLIWLHLLLFEYFLDKVAVVKANKYNISIMQNSNMSYLIQKE